MLLTDANVDHIGGLATLRQSGHHAFTVRSTAIVREIAIEQPAFAAFAQPPHRWLETPLGGVCEAVDSNDLLGGAIDVRAIPVPGLTPGFAGRRAVRGAVAAYEIRSRATGKTLLFAPVFAAIDDLLRDAIRRADIAFLDGSFYTDGELLEAGLMEKTARHLGHHPVGGRDGTLAQVNGSTARAIFTHLNNSNPMLDASSAAAREVASAGAAIAYDGMEFVL
jgi:pyrroloquinoline quinone biosynthesis protein B